MACALPDRADGVDDPFCVEAMTARDFGLAGEAASERAAFREQFWPGSAVDRAIDASAAKQRRIGGVDNGIDLEAGDVAFRGLDSACFHKERRGNYAVFRFRRSKKLYG